MAPEGLTINYTAVVIAGIVGFVGMAIMFAASFLLSPKKRTAIEDMPYECGIPPAHYSWSQLHMRYYIFAILFLTAVLLCLDHYHAILAYSMVLVAQKFFLVGVTQRRALDVEAQMNSA